MTLEQETLLFTEYLQSLYFEKRDMEAFLLELREGASWIGTGEQEFCRNLEDAKRALSLDMQAYKGHFTVVHSKYDVVCLSDKVSVVYGEITAQPENLDLADVYNRITAVCERTTEGMKLAHLHLSVPDADQEKGRFFVARDAAGERETLRLRTEKIAAKLREQSGELEALSENIPGGIHQCACDDNFTFLSVNQSFLSLVGYTKEEIKKRFHDHFAEIICPEDLPRVRVEMERQLLVGDEIEVEYRICRSDGEKLWILDHSRRVTLEDGSQCLYCMLMDITKQKQEREELRLSLERHQIITDQTTDIIFEWDMQKDTLVFSPNWRKKFGYEPIREKISQGIPRSINIHPKDMAAFIKIMKDSAAGVPYSETEFRIRDIFGKYTWSRIRATVQYDMQNKPIKAVGVIIDINSDKKRQQKLLEQVQRDPLTSLYNKKVIRELVEQKMADSAGQESHVLMIIDIDDFKQVNDSYGHLCGDSLLSDFATTLKSQLRRGDLVARIGGDEFLVYLSDVAEKEQVVIKIKSMLEALQKLRPAKEAPAISCSIGAAFFPQDANEYLSLFKCADGALYQTKKNGKSGVSFYNEGDYIVNPPAGVISSAVSIIDSDMGEGDVVGVKLAQYMFQMLYSAVDINTAVKHLLEIVGRAYNVSRVYIFENSEDGKSCTNTFEWCNIDIEPQIDKLKNVPYEELGNFRNCFDKDGIFYCQDIKELDASLYKILAPQGICSLLQCAIMDDGVFWGYVGFDECQENRTWTKEQIVSLALIAKVLSTFLLKQRLKERMD